VFETFPSDKTLFPFGDHRCSRIAEVAQCEKQNLVAQGETVDLEGGDVHYIFSILSLVGESEF